MPIDVGHHLSTIGDATHFPTVSEVEERLQQLHDASQGSTLLKTIGTSRGGQPISALTLGHGRVTSGRHAIVTGMPHPNEPTGTLGALALARLLVESPDLVDELGYVWHVVPCVDPDGAALNYGWYAGPYDRLTYAGHIYRPPFDEQYEWTFHRAELPQPGLEFIPESRALAELIDQVRPSLLMSMHNAEAAGLFSYVSRDLPGLSDAVGRLARSAGLPVYQGMPEEGAPVLAPGLFAMGEESGGLLEGMLGSTGYAAPYGTYGVVCEPPMWIHPDADNLALSDQTYAEVHAAFAAAQAAVSSEMDRWLGGLPADLLRDSARGRAVAAQLSYLDADLVESDADQRKAGDRCTVAYAVSVDETITMTRLRSAGHLLALLRDEVAAGSVEPSWHEATADVTATLEQWAGEEPALTFVGLGAAVRMHVGMALEVAQLLAADTAGRG